MQLNATAARVPAQPDVLYVITGLQVGGSERQLSVLASALGLSGMKVAVYSFVDGPVRAVLQQNGVEVVLAPGGGPSTWRGFLLATFHLLWFMARRRPRIAHFFLPASYLIGAPMAMLVRVPVRVMSRRSLNNYQRTSVARVAERCLHRTMHAILGNSRGVVEQLKAEGVAPTRLGLIYNGVDNRAYQEGNRRGETRAGLGLTPDALVICIVANLIPYKGHGDLIEALGRAAAQLPSPWRLLVVGHDTGIGPALQKRASELGLRENISFLGARDDIPALLGASDIGVLCSHQEGFANAVLEGMAAGLPMVVTRVGGNAEAVVDGETGFVVAPQDSEGLAAAILQLADDDTLRMRFGDAGRQRAVTQFGVQRFVESHRVLYQGLQAGRQPSDVAPVAIG